MLGDPSFKNRTIPGTEEQFQSFFKAVLGPTIAGVKKKAKECAAARCHGRGRCIDGTLGSVCLCERGFTSASNCSRTTWEFGQRAFKSDDDKQEEEEATVR